MKIFETMNNFEKTDKFIVMLVLKHPTKMMNKQKNNLKFYTNQNKDDIIRELRVYKKQQLQQIINEYYDNFGTLKFEKKMFVK